LPDDAAVALVESRDEAEAVGRIDPSIIVGDAAAIKRRAVALFETVLSGA